jgi:hypothetical protein
MAKNPHVQYDRMYDSLNDGFSMTTGGLKEKKGDNDFLLTLGKYKEGGGCLYINKLSDINQKELEKIIKLAVRRNK